jgi:parallel beta-helix repeat protein
VILGSIGNLFADNDITMLSGTGAPIFIAGAYGTSLIDNRINAVACFAGLDLNNANNTFLDGNNVTSGSGFGIVIADSGNMTLIDNTVITSTQSALTLDYGASTDVVVSGLTAKNTGGSGYAVYINGVGNVLFRDCVNISGGTADVGITAAAGGTNNTFVNCSYDTESVNGAANYLLRKWYFDANVTNTSGSPVDLASLSVYNGTDDLIASDVTDAGGDIDRLELIEYTNLGGTRYYANDYTVNVTKAGYFTNSTTYNLTALHNVFATIELNLTPGAVSSCQNITEAGYYTLTGDVNSTGTCFNVLSDDVTIDCAGYEISFASASTGSGVRNEDGYDNLTVRDCIINKTGGSYVSATGIDIGMSCAYNSLINNTITIENTAGYDISLFGNSDYAIIANNTLITSGDSLTNLYLYGADHARILNNTIYNDGYAGMSSVVFMITDNVTMRDNNINSTRSLGITITSGSDDDIDSSNLVDGLPVLYNESLEDVVVLEGDRSGDYGQVICLNCVNVTYRDLVLSHDGLSLFNTDNSTVTNLTVTDNTGPLLFLQYADRNTLTGLNLTSTMTGNFFAFFLDLSDNNSFTSLNITLAQDTGFSYVISKDHPNILSSGNNFTDFRFIGGEARLEQERGRFTDGYMQGTTPIIIDTSNDVSNVTLENVYVNSTSSYHFSVNDEGATTFRNVTTNDALSTLFNVATHTLYIEEFVDVNVTNSTGGMLAGAAITATDRTSTLRDSAVSSSTELTRLAVLKETRTSAATTNYNNYTIAASLALHNTNSTIVNVTNSSKYTGINHILLALYVSDVPPVIVLNNTFVNSTTAHSFTVKAGVRDGNGATDLRNTSITNGACSFTSNSSIGDYFNVTYTCSGTPYESDAMNITFCDSNDNCVTTPTSANSYPNQGPSVPTLITPSEGNHSIRQRHVFLNWTLASDVEDDPVTYTLNITNAYAPDYLRQDIVGANHTTQEELWTEYECMNASYLYFWRVRACDEWDCSSYTALWNFSIDDYLSVVITNDDVSFGANLDLNSINDTTDGNPAPFTFRNDGLILANLSNLTATDLWIDVALDTRYFQFKANNATEPACFDWSGSFTAWRNATAQTSETVIGRLNYSDASDEAAIDIRIEVPGVERGGSKLSTMTFTWRPAE